MNAHCAPFPSACRESRAAELADVDRHFGRRGHGPEFEMEAQWIARQLPSAARRVLDVGCGNGALFARTGHYRVVGIDYAHAGLCRTRATCPAARLACGDAVTLPFADACFEAVTAQHVIEHLTDSAAALREWKRVVCDGGVAIIVTPNLEYCDPTVFDDPTHVRIFNRGSLRAEIERSGLAVEKITTLGLPMFRQYNRLPGGWRLRQAVLRQAEFLSAIPGWNHSGQSLCCVARRKGGR